MYGVGMESLLDRHSLQNAFAKGGPIVKRWGNIVRTRRNSLKLSQEELALLSGISPSSVYRLEEGELCPLDATRCAVAAALGTSVDKLFPHPTRSELNDLYLSGGVAA